MPPTRASRPHMPGYGLAPAAGGEGLLPWSWAVERLERSRNYWVSSTNADGTPHSMAVWGVWLDDQFLFSTAASSRKIANLRREPRCTVTTERADEAVVVVGAFETITDPDLVRRFCDLYNQKYSWDMGESYAPFYLVRPRLAFGFIETDPRFTQTATRWHFDD
jgi:hypothetical protein